MEACGCLSRQSCSCNAPPGFQVEDGISQPLETEHRSCSQNCDWLQAELLLTEHCKISPNLPPQHTVISRSCPWGSDTPGNVSPSPEPRLFLVCCTSSPAGIFHASRPDKRAQPAKITSCLLTFNPQLTQQSKTHQSKVPPQFICTPHHSHSTQQLKKQHS